MKQKACGLQVSHFFAEPGWVPQFLWMWIEAQSASETEGNNLQKACLFYSTPVICVSSLLSNPPASAGECTEQCSKKHCVWHVKDVSFVNKAVAFKKGTAATKSCWKFSEMCFLKWKSFDLPMAKKIGMGLELGIRLWFVAYKILSEEFNLN